MTVCHYCREPIGAADWGDEADEHGACAAEWNRRYDAGKCTACGARDAAAGSHECDSCDSGSPYVGYGVTQ